MPIAWWLRWIYPDPVAEAGRSWVFLCRCRGAGLLRPSKRSANARDVMAAGLMLRESPPVSEMPYDYIGIALEMLT
jgi:hypothetical protein